MVPKSCKAFPKCVLGKFQLHPIEVIERHFQIFFKRNWIAPFWNYSKTFPKCVIAEIQLHHAESIVRHLQICLSRNSIASSLRYSTTFSTCVVAEIRQQPFEIIFKNFQILCQPKINCIVPKLFWDILKLYHDRNSIASYRNYCKTLSNCSLTAFRLQCTKNTEGHFRNVSQLKLICFLINIFWDIFKLCLSWNSVESFWIYSRTFSNCLLAQIFCMVTEML